MAVPAAVEPGKGFKLCVRAALLANAALVIVQRFQHLEAAGGPVPPGSGEIEPVGVHHLGPSGHEVAHELRLVVVLGIDLRQGTQD